MGDSGFSDLFGSWVSSFAHGFGSGVGGGLVRGSPGQTSAMQSPVQATPATFAADAIFDNGGWNVAFGGSSISATANKATNQNSRTRMAAFPAWNDLQLGQHAPLIVVGFVVLLLLKK